ncbi:hypothetical protein AX14_004307 [Amanita brunnescens Koide BX004]|nr:hypothetical protein AX14_004307 [Amanita brunnescens Koide BX004]
MPRDMSYRKPVPQYIPSPPPSPSTAQEESSSEEHSSEKIPPLPTEWREAIERALSLSNSAASSLTPSLDSSSDESDQPNRHHSIYMSNVTKRPAHTRSDSACSAAILSQEEKHQRQLHHVYRPPTPPLPKQRKHESSAEWLDSRSTLPNIPRVEKFHSTAMRLQRSHSTGQTLVAASPVKESPAMAAFAGRKEQLSMYTSVRTPAGMTV